MISSVLLLFPFFAVAFAANDWNTPCVTGQCSYDLPTTTSGPSGTMKIWGSENAITDITPAANWEIMGCDPTALSQNIRLVCMNNDPSSLCGHLYQNGGAVNKLVRLPENCGANAFARVSKSWIWTTIQALAIDTDFGSVDWSNAGKVNIAIEASNTPASTAAPSTITPAPLSRRARQKRRFLGEADSAVHQATSDVASLATKAASAVKSAASSAESAIASDTAVDTSKTFTPSPLTFSDTKNIFNTSVNCGGPVSSSLSVNVTGNVNVAPSITLTVNGTLIPPEFTEFQATTSMTAQLGGTLNLAADVTGSVDSGQITLLNVGIPGFDFPGVNAEFTGEVDLAMDMAVGINFNVNNAQLVFPPNDSNTVDSNAFSVGDTPLQLSASPSVQATGTLTAHLIPTINLGISAIGGKASATVFLALDTSASLVLSLDASARITGTIGDNSTSSAAVSSVEATATSSATDSSNTTTAATNSIINVAATTTSAEAASTASANATDSSSSAAGPSTTIANATATDSSVNATATAPVVDPSASALAGTRRDNTTTSAAFGGCVQVNAGLAVNAGAQGDFFGLFNDDAQRIALAACGSSRSYYNLQLAATLVKGATDSHKILFLPVFYAILDPAQIPTPADLESFQPDTRASLACASLALEVIFDIIDAVSKKYQEPDDVGPTLWPRMWPWIFFMHEYREYLGASSTFQDPQAYTRFLLFVADIYDPEPMRDIISSTPGFRVLLATTWTLLPKPRGEAYEGCLWFLAGIIASLDFTDPLHFAEVVDGAGGTLGDLARLMMRHMDDVVNGQFSWKIGSSASYMRDLARLILAPDSRYPVQQSTPPYFSTRQNFLETLRLHGFVPAFVVAMDTVLEACKSNPNSFLHDNFESSFVVTLELLEYLLNTTLGYQWLPAAIEAGLLRMMAGVATEFPSMFNDRLRFLLTKILPDGLLYYHVVVAMEKVLDEVTEIWSSEELEEMEIIDDWDSFRDLAENRVQLLDSAQSNRACDNLECGQIQDSSRCRRCSGCKTHYYCSSNCQITDWKHGGHRDHCGSPALLTLGETSLCPLGFRERNFLRAVVQADYADGIHSICEAQVMVMANHPADRFFTFFDYTDNQVQISVHSVVNSHIANDLKRVGSEWSEILSRASRSVGRVQLHVIRVPEGSETRLLVIPLRTNSSQIHDALRELARVIPTDSKEEDISDEVERILEQAVDVVEIH
ncbi:hypothetical protein K438DRAFT_1982156 [Mycena galopus ATCC 62051]|nr:hypothetical protein K438DRAFT_1982156 [Mycena galopus ATCC 62051]